MRYLRPNDSVLDIGNGGGETFSQLARFFGRGLGIDTDAEMIQLAVANSTSGNIRFRVGSARVLAGNVDERGFVTNEHRYLVVATHGGQLS
jgi:ubiquinone/menaquinone biosynthesis C-methylase UbiE